MSPDLRRPENLPQYGFGSKDLAFKILVDNNPFLYRVYTPLSGDPPDPFFTAPKFDPRYTSTCDAPSTDPPMPTYADAARHMDWTTRHSSPYVSASFSLMWAVWEALRRYHFGVKHDVEIAIIDAGAVAARATTTMELLQSVPPGERHASHWKWSRFADESQSVLVYGAIPQHCVLASLPLLRVLDNLPVLLSAAMAIIGTPAPHPHQSPSFARASPEARFRDTTAGTVQLALTFLGTWMHWMLQLRPPPENEHEPNLFRDAAATKVSELARTIAMWPAAGETIDMWDIVVHEISRLVAQEVNLHRPIPGAENPSAPVSNQKFDILPDVAIVLDPRNYLPTPPLTPPPAFTHLPADNPPHTPALSPLIEPAFPSDVFPGLGSATSSPKATDDVAEIPDIPPQVVPELDVAHTHSRGETASCLLTGFFFGALIVLVVSQRRPTLMHLS
ncbi:hypothetical protein DFH09DRAFT_1369165 [Mycena vulgaris]|nr:hypothetical protein DFH09DRAFT_1369165 [Mycena vulgaris]